MPTPHGTATGIGGYNGRRSRTGRPQATSVVLRDLLNRRIEHAVTTRATDTKPNQHALVEALVDALATYRLTVLIKDDKITERLRQAVFRRYGHLGDPDVRKPSYLLGCPWCLSMYFDALAVLGRRYAPGAWEPLSRAMAFSATTGLLAEVVASRPHGHE
jgi:hypothetical protein